eukprot:744521-Prorocentrum_minimum.AAC.1
MYRLLRRWKEKGDSPKDAVQLPSPTSALRLQPTSIVCKGDSGVHLIPWDSTGVGCRVCKRGPSSST